jgi:hypothetical protein
MNSFDFAFIDAEKATFDLYRGALGSYRDDGHFGAGKRQS